MIPDLPALLTLAAETAFRVPTEAVPTKREVRQALVGVYADLPSRVQLKTLRAAAEVGTRHVLAGSGWRTHALQPALVNILQTKPFYYRGDFRNISVVLVHFKTADAYLTIPAVPGELVACRAVASNPTGRVATPTVATQMEHRSTLVPVLEPEHFVLTR